MDKKLIRLYSSVVASKNKTAIILLLNDKVLTPKNIAKKLGIRINHISSYLTVLKSEDLIICLNEDKKKGRLYQLTELGISIYNELKKNIE